MKKGKRLKLRVLTKKPFYETNAGKLAMRQGAKDCVLSTLEYLQVRNPGEYFKGFEF